MSKVQNVFLIGAKSLGAYGGYETFVYKLTEYHQNNPNIKYHVACKANGDGCMDETKLDNVKRVSDSEFEFHNARCFKIHIPQIGPAQAIYYDVAALRECCKYIKFLNELENKLHFRGDSRIKFVGTVYDQELLKKIRENAYAYFHGHTVGGTNPSLIEALGSTDLNLLVDVGFNKEVAEDCALYWSQEPGDLANLIDKADVMNVDEITKIGKKATLLRKIDNRYCVSSRDENGNIKTYGYGLRNKSTSNVHMILYTALMKMMDGTMS